MGTASGDETLLWEPSEELKQQATLTRYMQWLEREKGLYVRDQEELWHWSVSHLEDFWASIWDFFSVKASRPYTSVLADRKMPGAQWFGGAELNYAEQVFRNASVGYPALLFQSERHPLRAVSWEELSRNVGSVANALRALGVKPGDRVVSYMANLPETVIAFLACASIGAVWSSCPPDFGTSSVIERFQQIEPKVLFAVDGYQYNGKEVDRRSVLSELQQALPTLHTTVLLPYLSKDTDTEGETSMVLWHDFLSSDTTLTFEQVPFEHPLWVLYSSGTTGLPKAIVQGHGGIVLEHLKSVGLSLDLKPGDIFFWYTTTGWMMWNILVGGLLVGTTILLYDGSPAYPTLNMLWKLAQESGMTFFGTSAGYITSCMKAGLEPGTTYDLSKLRAIGSTGSPLPPEGFGWVYEHVKRDIWLASISGGTDVCSAFVGGSVLLPVYAGELQCRALGAKVEAFDEQGHPVINEVGELVLTEPLPSMPLYFWNDPGNTRYQESYFDVYPGVWRHGDWIKITPRGSAIIYGRSDSTINRQGIRMGSSEIYRVVEALPEVLDSLIVGVELPGGKYYLPLFVVLREGVELDDALKAKIKQQLRTNVSPHHVPDEIIAIEEVPRTLSGKKLEVPVKKLLMGMPIEKAISMDALNNPQAMEYFIEFAQKMRTFGKASKS
ncbi:MAG: acetoacetate--CoA ligase [Ktedonobacter sp. 13_1_20CM_3_54_15]|jgi:acetoacetyl-CoA synthetase|nr:MAG: acetoacetate--CoA ligase [Ktedonobacter sp. 13_2_20CM_53_11]OLB57009.1 MAG: acetoacetate--CoA ligase [Ktedonobacter sp. 13_2_20CM_2_56_8]OLE03016.1 MAG: acetoacetate--CoA ligase [Ktedonobacter sp. 13_1_20CM_4_53_11]OLE33428.1 MAG: acetoacetate--CoA ligase [Ktedonobacter sp. 13_1_20CM_3_54_15]TMC27377.1 MAG: acetoacetate--CoA ligase [Chloroflexota bacterium]